MAAKYKGAVGGVDQQRYRKEGPKSARFQELVDRLNVGPQTEAVLSQTHSELRDLFSQVVDEQVQPEQEYLSRISPEARDWYQAQQKGRVGPPPPPNTYVPNYDVSTTYNMGDTEYSGPGLQARTAARIGEDQVNFGPELVSQLYPNAKGDPRKPLSLDEEGFYLEEFARLKGVSTLDVERSPVLREEFERYVGKKIKSLAPDAYYPYSTEGEAVTGTGTRPTYWKKAGHIAEYNRIKHPESTSAPMLQERARGVEEDVINTLQMYGMSETEAQALWKRNQNLNPDESILLQALRSNPELLSRATTFDEQIGERDFEDGLLQMSEKVHKSFLKTLGHLKISEVEKFADKILKNSPHYNRTSLQQAIYSFMVAYSAAQETDISGQVDLGRAWSDFFMAATFVYARNKVQQHEQKKRESDDPAKIKQTTQEAIEANEKNLMVSVSDHGNIARLILEPMGFPEATPEQQAVIGALAQNLVVDAFAYPEAHIEDITMPEEKLFEKVPHKEVDNQGRPTGKITNTFTLTAKGLEIANKALPLFNLIMPKSQRKVRVKPKRSLEKDQYIRKIGRNTKTKYTDISTGEIIEGGQVDIGETKEMTEMRNQAENTPGKINPLMNGIMTLIGDDYQSIMLKHRNKMDTDQARADYETTLMYLLDGPEFQNMKGDGTGNKGIFGNRSNFVYVKDRQGNILDEEGKITTDLANAAILNDYSDRIKDTEFDQALVFLAENFDAKTGLGREFFWDYFWGFNTRLNVDQTQGNYQQSKMIRGLINSGKPANYKLDDAYHVISLKAGIIKRFGFDKMDPLTAADHFDKVIGDWSTANPATPEGVRKILEIAGEYEGWGSVASMVEGIAFNKELSNPNSKGVYTTGFFTEIDGLTNGMAHSSAQAGDIETAWRAQMFDPMKYNHWVTAYADIEKIQREGNIEELAKLNDKYGVDGIDFTIYMDAYNKTNYEMKELIRRLWGDGEHPAVDIDYVGLPGLLTTAADAAAQTIMGLAHESGQGGKGVGSRRFKDALTIMKNRKHPLSRKFVKKPVMIFGYGAGTARIRQAIQLFVDDIFMQDPELAKIFTQHGIDIDKHFINPLGVIASEAVNQSFEEIKAFANVLSRAATEAHNQGFPLRIPTSAGYFINLGGKVYAIDRERGPTRFDYYPGDFAMMMRMDDAKNIDPKTGKVRKPRAYSWTMKGHFDPFFMKENYLKAATQITVLLNHANDNINMQRHLVNVHKQLLAKVKDKNGNPYTWDKWLYNLETDTDRVIGNTALHIFDGILAMPIEAEMHANGLNRVFQQMMQGERGHASAVYDALTFELTADGKKIRDRRGNNIGKRNIDAPNALWKPDYEFRRLLNRDGEALAADEGWGTWHPDLDPFAYNWGKSAESAQVRIDLRTIERNRKDLAKKLSTKLGGQIKQFFWSPEPVQKMMMRAGISGNI